MPPPCAFCQDDAPYLAYEVTTNAPGSTATITFTGDGGSEALGVDLPSGVVLWPGATIGSDGAGTGWPGWDQDDDGAWFENPASAYAWARGAVDVTVTVNPTTDPVTVAYPPGTADCLTAPASDQATPTAPPTDPATDSPSGSSPTGVPPSAGPTMPSSGADAAAPAVIAALLAMFGAACVLLSRRFGSR